MRKTKAITYTVHEDDLAELQVLAAQASAELRDSKTVKYADIIRHALSEQYGIERRGRIAERLKQEWGK